MSSLSSSEPDRADLRRLLLQVAVSILDVLAKYSDKLCIIERLRACKEGEFRHARAPSCFFPFHLFFGFELSSLVCEELARL